MFIQTQSTPNPDALKFIPGTDVSPQQPVYFNNREESIRKSALAFKLFEISGIKTVFYGSDFITITKVSELEWNVLKPEILMTIMDHLVSELPIFDNENNNISIDLADKSDIEKQIIEIIETRVRPSVAMDGGDIIYKGFEDGIVKLKLQGSCAGCPSSNITLKNGIESMLKHFVPEVESVEAIEDFE